MSETRWTPRPWAVSPATWHRGSGPYKEAISAGGNGTIANVLNKGTGKFSKPKFGDRTVEWTPPPTSAEAHLIAASPDLYEALRKAAYELNTIRARDGVPWTGVPVPMRTDVTEEYFSSVVDECHAALAKARGESI